MSEVTQFIPPHALSTAVLFLVFNRLDTTEQVFHAIRQAKPPRLYIAADGARANKQGEARNVQAVRDYIMQNIDWECEVKTLFRDQNLGCKYAVSGAITWFFDHEEQGIILEDDCLPSQSFFWYCEELLERYEDDKSVYLVSGDSRGPDSFGMREDYGFCRYPMIWGWASWASVWKNYDPELLDWPQQRKSLPPSISTYKSTVIFWRNIFERLHNGKIDTWDYQFSYLLLKNGGKSIVPKVNLITNIGFGVEATHTTSAESNSANRKRYEISIPLDHSPNQTSEMKINAFYDEFEFSSRSLFVRVINKLARSAIGENLFP